MGSTFTAIADDSSAAYWNPAGLAQLKGIHLLTGVAPGGWAWIVPNNYRFANTSVTIRPVTIAGTLTRLTVNTQTVTQNDSAFWISGAGKPLKILMIGANVKLYTRSIDGTGGSGLGYDLGVLLNFKDLLSFGAIAYDIGNTQLNYPLGVMESHYKVGTALRLINKAVLIAGDLTVRDSNGTVPHVGLEVKPDRILKWLPFNPAFRCGIIFSGGTNISVGTGLSLWNLSIDTVYLFKKHSDGIPVDTFIISGKFNFTL